MPTKNIYVILDTETVTDARFIFDVAWKVYDAKGNFLTSANFLVDEVVNSVLGLPMLSRDSFSKRKYPFYRDAITFDSVPVAKLSTIAAEFNALQYEYNANVIMCAYNAAFDICVLNQNCNWFYGENFFDDSVKYLDIMVAAMGTICATNKYVNYCISNGFVTEKGNVKTSAETVYQYLTNNVDFSESHTALADCDIEAEIFFKAKSYKKKLVHRLAQPVFRCPEWKAIQNKR